MKDLESKISHSATNPRCPLPDNFTNKTMDAIENPTSKRMTSHQRIKDMLTMNHFSLHKPAMVLGSIVLLAGLSGTAYAVVSNWPQPSASTSTIKVRGNGNRIVQVSLQNCIDPNAFSYSLGKPGNQKMYFEVKKGAPVTNAELEESAIDSCNDSARTQGTQNLLSKIDPSTQTQKPADQIRAKELYSVMNVKIVSMQADSVTFTTPAIGGAGGADSSDNSPIEKTFSLSHSVLTYDYTQSATKDSIKPGDSAVVVVKATGVSWPEYTTSNSVLNTPGVWDASFQTVGIMKVPDTNNTSVTDLVAQYGQKSLSNDVVGAGPCNSDPDGFCRNYFPSEMEQKHIEPISKYLNPFN